jgi:hypothetical protein
MRHPASRTWPASFVEAVAYTRRDRARNGESRTAAKLGVASGSGPVLQFKGTGSAGKNRRTKAQSAA